MISELEYQNALQTIAQYKIEQSTKETVVYGDYVQLNDRFESVHIWSKEVETKCNRRRYDGSVPFIPLKITKEVYDREMKHPWNN